MGKSTVGNAEQALAYITDCTLATVEHMASLESKRKGHEYRRQIAIAQCAIGWIQKFGVDYSETRAKEVVERFNGDVAKWAESYMGDRL